MKSESIPTLALPKLAALAKKHTPSQPAAAPADPVHTIVQSFLLWEASTAHANAALERIARQCVDFNELRVCQPEEIVSILPNRYPYLEERADRLRRSLNDLYRREHKLSLAHLASMGKREQRAYVEHLDGMLPFVSSRILLLHFGHSLVPCDDQLVDLLVAAKIMTAPVPAADAGAALVKSTGSVEEALRLHHALVAAADRAWADDSKSVQKAKQTRVAAIESARREARRAAEARARAEAKAAAVIEAKAQREEAARLKAEAKAKEEEKLRAAERAKAAKAQAREAAKQAAREAAKAQEKRDRGKPAGGGGGAKPSKGKSKNKPAAKSTKAASGSSRAATPSTKPQTRRPATKARPAQPAPKPTAKPTAKPVGKKGGR